MAQNGGGSAVTVADAHKLGGGVPSLSRWGVTPDADLGYRTLVIFGPSTLAGLAATLGMPRRRVEDALDTLDLAGAAGERMTARGHPVWTARDATAVIADLERAIQRCWPRSPGPVVDRVELAEG